MQRNSSLVSIWLQLELCAMAVLLTKGEWIQFIWSEETPHLYINDTVELQLLAFVMKSKKCIYSYNKYVY